MVKKVLRPGRYKDLLHGVGLGHPLHPGLAQLALGCLVSATVIDVGGGSQRESSRLIATGLLAAVPTAAAGWADYAEGHEEQQRVGVVHAVTNVAALSCYAGALWRRRGGRSGARLLSLTGAALGGLGAVLGGHLSFGQASGANHGEEVQHVGPADWQRVGSVTDLPVGRPVRRMIGDPPAFVLHQRPPNQTAADRQAVNAAEVVSVLSDRCPHLSAPLHEGELDTRDGQLQITCPWHGSVFRVSDGGVEHGPATAPVPRFETRIDAGVLYARVLTLPGVEAS
jgi:nitrite reductase/ring-hydroxylating ferredoxin subunit/uncharacterized membrane protein